MFSEITSTLRRIKMSKDTTKPETKTALKDEVLQLAASIEKAITIDKKTGEGSVGENDVYHDNLPATLTREVVKEVSAYNTNFIAAGAYAFGKIAVDAMKGNKSLEKANIEFKMGDRDTVGFTVDRRKEHSNPAGAEGDVIEKFGVITPKYSTRADKTSAGQLKVARSLIGELAMEKLKG